MPLWDEGVVVEGGQNGVPCLGLHDQVREQETEVVARTWEAWEHQAREVDGRQIGATCPCLHARVWGQEAAEERYQPGAAKEAFPWVHGQSWECQELAVGEY